MFVPKLLAPNLIAPNPLKGAFNLQNVEPPFRGAGGQKDGRGVKKEQG
jgi:hypothetical protein